MITLYLFIDLPRLSRPLTKSKQQFSNKYITLVLNKWNISKGDSGEGPVVGYIIKYKLLTSQYHYLSLYRNLV